MKVKKKSTGEVFICAEWATIATTICDSWGNPIEIPVEDAELIND